MTVMFELMLMQNAELQKSNAFIDDEDQDSYVWADAELQKLNALVWCNTWPWLSTGTTWVSADSTLQHK